MQRKAVSVIIPFYNRFTFLHDAIMSVVNQTYRPVEIILVDDCSDETFSIDRYDDTGVPMMYLRHPSNMGPAMSRFSGLDHCTGEYVVFLDSDDLLDPRFVERQVLTLENSDDAVFSYCFTKEFSSSGVVGDRQKPQVSIQRILPEMILSGRIWCTSSCLWKKRYLLSIDRFGGYTWEDYRLDVAAALLRNVVVCTPEYLCYYRVDTEGKLSRDRNRHHAKLLYSVDGILQTIWKSGQSFPSFDCVVARIEGKYLSCLIELNDHDQIKQMCRNASNVKLFPRTIRCLLSLAALLPRKLRYIAIRLSKRIFGKMQASACQ